jgi:RNA polymerase sigma-70 factor (ECF subfamily)
MTLEERIAAVYEELRMDVYRYVVTLGMPQQAAQDIAQDSFVRLYETLRNGSTVAHERAWLLRVAHNMAMNAVGAKDFSTIELSDEAVAITRTAEENLIEAERRARLRRAIKRLSAQQRACLELRAQGLRYREIGEIIGINTSTVGEFLRRAVRNLQEALDE